MKNILAAIILAALSFTAQSAEITIGQAQISHFLKVGDDNQKLTFNEKNEFINVKFNKISVGAFENSFGDIAPYINYEVFSAELAGLTFNATAGVAYYKDNMVDAEYKTEALTAKFNGKYEVKDVTTLLPTVNLNVSKTFAKHITVGASYGGAYVGTFATYTF